MIPLLVIIALGVLAILAVALRMAIDLRAIRAGILPDLHAALLRESRIRPSLQFNHIPHHHMHGMKAMHLHHATRAGHNATWEWRDGGWRLVPHKLPSGVDPGPPPARPGTYDGEVVTTWIPGQE
jgi:hypothetical protein